MPRVPHPAKIAAALLLLGALAFGETARAAERRVAVRPFEVYNAPDLQASAPGLQAALAGRLSGSGLEVSTVAAGDPVEADWAVRVTLTKVGSRISVDGSAAPVSGRGNTIRAFEVAEDADGLLPALNAVAAKLRKEISGAPLPAPSSTADARAPTPPAAAPPATIAPPVAPAVVAPVPPAAAPPVAPAVVAPVPPAAAVPATIAPPVAPAVVVPVPPAVAPPLPPVPPQAVPVQAAKPPAPPQGTAQPGPAPAQDTAPQTKDVQDLTSPLKSYRMAAALNGQARSVAVSDVDKDGSAEVLVLTDSEIVGYRDGGGDLTVLWQLAVRREIQPCYVSSGDLDGDGLPEVFVAGMSGGTPFTEVYQWAGGALAPRSVIQTAFLRAVVHPEEGLILLGQNRGNSGDIFAPGLRRFAWRNGDYREEGPFRAAPTALITNIDWLRLREGPPLTVVTTQEDKLRIFDASGGKLSDGTEEVKGSENSVSGGDGVRQEALEGDFFRIQGKNLAWIDAGGTPHLLLQKNHAFTTIFRRARSYSQGQVLSYRWQALNLVPTGESPRIPGWLADLDLGPSPTRPGGATLYGILSQSEGIFSTKSKTRLLAWDL